MLNQPCLTITVTLVPPDIANVTKDLVRVRLQSEAGRLGTDGNYATGLRTAVRRREFDIVEGLGMRSWLVGGGYLMGFNG